MLERVADWSYRRRRRVVLLWLAALVVSIGLASAFGGEFNQDFSAPSSDSTTAFDLLDARFPAQGGNTIDLVYRADAGTTDPGVQARIKALTDEIAGDPLVDNVTVVPAPSLDPTIGAYTIQLVNTGDRADDDVTGVKRIVATIHAAEGDGLQVEAGGQVVAETEQGN